MSKIIIENLKNIGIRRNDLIKAGFSPQKYDDVLRGKSSYKINDIVEISEKFHLSLDYLILGRNKEVAETSSGVSITERILELMDINNIKASQLTKELEISSSSITDWKKGKAKPSVDAIVKISKYFNVSTDYIIIGSNTSTIITESEREMLNLFRKFNDREQLKVIGRLEEWLSNVEAKAQV